MTRVKGGVILCSGRKSTASAANVAKLIAKFAQFPLTSFEDVDGTSEFPVVKTGNFVDGGNGGGGEGPDGMVFVAGQDRVGVWNFRYLPASPNKVGDQYNLADFPVVGRIELCIHVTDISDAASDLAADSKLRFLKDVFDYVLLIPFSIRN